VQRVEVPAVAFSLNAQPHESICALGKRQIAPNQHKYGGTQMQTTPRPLRPAQAEVHRTAHNQDLIEVPKRARLDREAEGRQIPQVFPVIDSQ
jgi:hypothetical protein